MIKHVKWLLVLSSLTLYCNNDCMAQQLDGVNQLNSSLRTVKAVKTVIPRDEPSSNTRSVLFNNSLEWYRSSRESLRLSDFSSVEHVEIRHSLDARMSKFIAKFPKLVHVSIVELSKGIDLSSAISPLAESKSLRSFELSMVEVSYQDCSFFSKFNQLHSLTCDVTCSKIELNAFQKLPNLKHLEIGATASETQMLNLSFPALKSLTLSSPSSLRCFNTEQNLESLKIWSPCGTEHLSQVSKFESLTHVDIRVRSLNELQPLDSLNRLKSLKIGLEKQ